MSECICNTCKNLKGIMDESGAVGQYECEFGFPSDICVECSGEECEVSCVNYVNDELEIPVKVKCAGCGRELEQVCSDGSDGGVFCISCYLKGI